MRPRGPLPFSCAVLTHVLACAPTRTPAAPRDVQRASVTLREGASAPAPVGSLVVESSAARDEAPTAAPMQPSRFAARTRDSEELGPVALTGCPPPPRRERPRRTSFPPRWRPPTFVPDAALPAPSEPAPRTASLRVLEGRGAWIWRARLCEHGDPEAIVARAQRAGLRQLWVRVGDSRDGFYAAATLEPLVSRAHAAGISVIGWGFPYLYDPAADAAWAREALTWRSGDGHSLDGFSPDIESGSEGTRLSARRVVAYLSLVRPAAAASGRPLVATVIRPTGRWLARYPYRAMAPYVDAFVPMVYWGCNEPGISAVNTIRVLAPLAPVHVIGQAYDMVDEGGRAGDPSGDEIARFCDASQRAGALGASLWHWQSMTEPQWQALGASYWPSGS